MFQDLDATLKALLDDPAAPADLRGADVSFETPDKDFQPPQPTVSLFLYEVKENRALRDTAPVLERVADTYISRQPPVRMDCTYLGTTWSSKAGGLKAEEEHRLLGLALLWLNRFPIIDAGFLRGSLQHPPQPYPLPAAVAQTGEDQSMGQFWTALGIAPRPAFSLTVTIAMPSLDDADEFPVTKAVEVSPASLNDPRLTGRIEDSTLTPVAGAAVTVVESGAQVTAGPDGGFSFAGLEFGTYTLLVHAAGHPDLRITVEYAIDSQLHDVFLPAP